MSSQKKSTTSSKQSLKTDIQGQLSEFYKQLIKLIYKNH